MKNFFEFDPYWFLMKWICIGFFALYAVLAFTGCTTISIKAPDGTVVERTSLFTDSSIGDLSGSKSENGRVTFSLHEYKSEQIEAARAIAEGVSEGIVTGASKAFKP